MALISECVRKGSCRAGITICLVQYCWSLQGGHCCSRHAITFHGVNPVDMFLLEYLVYGLHVGPGGGLSPTSSPPANAPMELASLLRGKAFVKPYGIIAGTS